MVVAGGGFVYRAKRNNIYCQREREMQMSSVERNERGELFGRSECSSTTALCYSGIGDG